MYKTAINISMILFVLWATGCSSSPTKGFKIQTTLEELKLSGPVKEVSRVQYSITKTNEISDISRAVPGFPKEFNRAGFTIWNDGVDGNRSNVRKTYEYNKHNYLTKVSFSHNDKVYKEINITHTAEGVAKSSQVVDSTGKILERYENRFTRKKGVITRSEFHNDTLVRKVYTKNNRVIKIEHFAKDGSLRSTSEGTFYANGIIKTLRISSTQTINDREHTYGSIMYNNEKGHLIKSEALDPKISASPTVTYEYTYDKHGNWLTKKGRMGMFLTTFEKQTITYFE